MLNIEEYLKALKAIDSEEAVLDFCRRRILHGTPAVFAGNEDSYYEFRKRIAKHFGINYHEVFITGSAKLGFNPNEKRLFGLESDIDIAIISAELYDRIMSSIHKYQMAIRENRKAVTCSELQKYHLFLEYGAIGWMRPDKLPTSFLIDEIKTAWFNYFDSISHGKSEVGNYKVSAGAFKSYSHLERYTLSGVCSLRTKLQIGALNAASNTA